MNKPWGGPMADVFRFQQADAGTHRVQDLKPWDFRSFGGTGAKLRAFWPELSV